jgi:hypothetical protein
MTVYTYDQIRNKAVTYVRVVNDDSKLTCVSCHYNLFKLLSSMVMSCLECEQKMIVIKTDLFKPIKIVTV